MPAFILRYAAIDEVVKDFGNLVTIMINTGICPEHACEEYTPKRFQEIKDVSAKAAFYIARVFRRDGFGNVVFTASISATCDITRLHDRLQYVPLLLIFRVCIKRW